MATKKKQEAINLIEIFSEFKELKNIDKKTFINVMEDSFRIALTKLYGSADNYDIIVNPDMGDLEIYRNRKVVEDDKDPINPNSEIRLKDARLIDEECELDEDITDTVDIRNDFGRRMILNLRQTLASKILDLQKESLAIKYEALLGQIVTVKVNQIFKTETRVLDEDDNELYLPKANQIPSPDREHRGDSWKLRKGEDINAVVVAIENRNQNPRVILSRTANEFLVRLMEREIIEVAEGIIAIKGVARKPGDRAKVAVESIDDRIDPVGACVGPKGSRIHSIVRELCNENIDVIHYTSNISLYIQRALAPAKITEVDLNEEEKRASVYLKPEDVSLAIGKNGSNIRLASDLTGYHIDIYSEADTDEEDIMLDEFNDEIDQDIIDQFKAEGFDTALQVLNVSRDEILSRVDVEEETLDHILAVLKAEFEGDVPAEEPAQAPVEEPKEEPTKDENE